MRTNTIADRQRVVVLSGATDGVGLELARIYSARGDRVVPIGRRPLNEIDKSAFQSGDYCRVDLRADSAAVEVDEHLVSLGVDKVDLLIHCAAAGWFGDFCDQSEASIREVLTVDLLTPIRLTHILAGRILSCGGTVTCISSVAACLPSPNYAIYAAAKAGLEAFARSLRVEWAVQANVVTVRLGAVQPGLHARSGMHVEERQRRRWPTAKAVATRIAKVVDLRKSTTLGFWSGIAALLGRQFPRFAERCLGGLATTMGSTAGKWVVTGAASGIGKAVCEKLSACNADLVGVDISGKGLADLAAHLNQGNGAIQTLIADLAQAATASELERELSLGESLSGVVFNAGISAIGEFERINMTQHETVLGLNLMSPILLTHKLLQANLVQSGATLVYVSSLSHFVGYPGAAVYAATKSALASFASSLRVSLSKRGVNVLTVYPGPTRTEHARRYSPDNSKEHRRMPPETLASQIVLAIASGRAILIPGFPNHIAAFFGRGFPRLMDRIMRRILFESISRKRSLKTDPKIDLKTFDES